MHDTMREIAFSISQGNPGALQIVREIMDNPDKRQLAQDLQMLKESGIVGSRLYMAYSDIRETYLRYLETQPEGYKNPFDKMTVSQMLSYIKERDPVYIDHLNRLLTKQGHEPVQ